MPNASVDRGVLIIYFWDRLTDFLFYIFLRIPDPPASKIAALVLQGGVCRSQGRRGRKPRKWICPNQVESSLLVSFGHTKWGSSRIKSKLCMDRSTRRHTLEIAGLAPG